MLQSGHVRKGLVTEMVFSGLTELHQVALQQAGCCRLRGFLASQRGDTLNDPAVSWLELLCTLIIISDYAYAWWGLCGWTMKCWKGEGWAQEADPRVGGQGVMLDAVTPCRTSQWSQQICDSPSRHRPPRHHSVWTQCRCPQGHLMVLVWGHLCNISYRKAGLHNLSFTAVCHRWLTLMRQDAECFCLSWECMPCCFFI